MSIAVFSAMLLAAAPTPVAITPEATVAAIYAPYNGPVDASPPWDYPIYSRQLMDLIAEWRRSAPTDEPDALSDGDWLCLCQDFDRGKVVHRVHSRRRLRSGAVELAVRLDLGHDTTRNLRLLLKRENGAWRLDDLFGTPDLPRGLKQKLRETIVENLVP